MTFPKATASANVNDGTVNANINWNQQLTPGTYTIAAEYEQNMTYESSNGTGTLTINKIDTTTILTLSSNTSNVGSSITLTIKMLERGTYIHHGIIKIYDNDTLINTVNVDSTTTSIAYNCQTVGTHNIYATWEDTTGQYNNSTSNTEELTIGASKKTVTSIEVVYRATQGAGAYQYITMFGVFKDADGNAITLDTSYFNRTISEGQGGYGGTFPARSINPQLQVTYLNDPNVKNFAFYLKIDAPYMELIVPPST